MKGLGRSGRSWPYVAVEDVGRLPHIVVDGSTNPTTVLTLSHWPHSPTPRRWAHDLSAGIVFNFLASRRGRGAFLASRQGGGAGAVACTNDHFDQDGLMGIAALVRPEESWSMRTHLIDVARAGDFASFADRQAGRVSFALAGLADPAITSLDPDLFARQVSGAGLAGRLYPAMLRILPDLLAHPDRYRAMWGEEDAAFEASQQDLATGRVVVTEDPELDLAVVRVSTDVPRRRATRFSGPADGPVHPAALHRTTSCLRVLTIWGEHYELVFRYESWVKLSPRRGLPRVDMSPAVAELNADEVSMSAKTTSGDPAALDRSGPWSFNGAGALVAKMTTNPASSLSPDHVLGCVRRHLLTAPIAWDPYRARPRPEAHGG
ncbi:MAG: DUF6687 family protein [Acidimicrobiales bacterium]